jgi:hypothetical protein
MCHSFLDIYASYTRSLWNFNENPTSWMRQSIKHEVIITATLCRTLPTVLDISDDTEHVQ